MINFFKNFAKGVLYVLVLPALLVVLVLYAVGALFVFIYIAIKGLILFFTGRSLYEDLPEDKEAKRRLGILPPEPATEPVVTSVKIESQSATNIEPDDTEEDDIDSNDPFYVPEYLKTQEQRETITPVNAVKVEEKHEEETKAEPQVAPQPVVEEQHEEIIKEEPVFEEKTSQNANIFSISDVDDMDDSDDDNDHSGINIDFE